MAQTPEPRSTPLQVAGVVSFYMVAALVMVFVNKAVLNKTPNLPISFLFIQMFIAVLLLHLVSFLSSTRFIPFKIAVPSFELLIAKKLLPYAIVGVAGLIFNTLCLAYVDASFFQIARGLLLPFTIAVSAVATRTRPKSQVLVAAFVITVGYFIGVTPASYLSNATNPASLRARLLPLVYGSLSSFMLALHAVLMKSAVTHVGPENSVVKLMYYSNLMNAMFLLPFIFLDDEVPFLMARITAGDEEWRVFVIGCGVTGVFGFLLGLANLLSIKVTSPVTHMVSSAARSVLQTVLGVYFFRDVITTDRGASIFIITVGALFYTWVQSRKPPVPKGEAIQLPPSPNLDADLEKGKQ